MSVKIIKGSEQLVKPNYNFKLKELHPNSNARLSDQQLPDEIYLTDEVILGLQVIRDYYKVPILINSTARTPAFQKKLGGGANSQHVSKKENGYLSSAIDLSFQKDPDRKYLKDYHYQILKKGNLYNLLKSAGIKGFGLYDNFIHIDGGQRQNEALWDNRATTKGKESVITKIADNVNQFLNADTEDGNEDFNLQYNGNKLGFIFVLVIIFILVK